MVDAGGTRPGDIGGTLKRILRRAVTALDGSAGMLTLWRDGEAEPYYQVAIGLRGTAAEQVGTRLAAAREEFERPARTPNDGARPLQTETTVEVGSVPLHLALLPLRAEPRTLGLIGVLRAAEAFTPTEERILAAFADQAGISVRNAALVGLLRRERATLRRVMEQSTDGIIVLDHHRRILSVNVALEQMSGHRRQDLVGKRLDEALTVRPARGSGGAARVFADVDSESSRQREVEAILQARDGALVHVALIAPLPVDQDAPDGEVILYVRNVTRLHELEELRTTFLSMTSHELQTPVAIIKAYAESQERKYGDGDALLLDALHAINGETDRLARLIDNLLRVSRLEAGALPVRLVDLDLAALAARVVRRLRARTTRHTFAVQFPDAFPHVQADPERMEEVLSNLVDNAIKYSPDGGAITVAGSVTPSGVDVSVSDEGPGIPLREQPRLFQRFYRAQGGPNRQTTGVGLGLYLVRVIVEAHGGRIWLDSEWGKGTKVTFSLPRPAGIALPRGMASDPPDERGDRAI